MSAQEPEMSPSLAASGLVLGFGRRAEGASQETREATRARVAGDVATRGRLLLLQQVHGARVQVAPWEGRPEADAAAATAPGLILGIETADCLPVLLFDPRKRAVAAAHAGWRGTVLGVSRIALEALVSLGSRPDDVRAVLGPAIGPCCYEVGEDVKQAFGSAGTGLFRPGPRGRDHLDVRAANRRQLIEARVPAEQIDDVPECTFCLADRYHSYRRDGPGSGRMISYVGFGY